MAKVITFSRNFPAYHPKAGQPTGFAFKFWRSLPLRSWELSEYMEAYRKVHPWCESEFASWAQHPPKYHTIRAGDRWNVGEKFSPRVWSGKPYNSKMITLAPDITIEKIWNVEVDSDLCLWVLTDKEGEDDDLLEKVAMNDGLSLQDLRDWFNKPMIGQIICWSSKIDY